MFQTCPEHVFGIGRYPRILGTESDGWPYYVHFFIHVITACCHSQSCVFSSTLNKKTLQINQIFWINVWIFFNSSVEESALNFYFWNCSNSTLILAKIHFFIFHVLFFNNNSWHKIQLDQMVCLVFHLCNFSFNTIKKFVCFLLLSRGITHDNSVKDAAIALPIAMALRVLPMIGVEGITHSSSFRVLLVELPWRCNLVSLKIVSPVATALRAPSMTHVKGATVGNDGTPLQWCQGG